MRRTVYHVIGNLLEQVMNQLELLPAVIAWIIKHCCQSRWQGVMSADKPSTESSEVLSFSS